MKNLLISVLALGALIAPAVSHSMFGRLGQRAGQRVLRPGLPTYNLGQRRLSTGLVPRVGKPGLSARLGAYGLLGQRGLTTGLRPGLPTYNLGQRGISTGLETHEFNAQNKVKREIKKHEDDMAWWKEHRRGREMG